MNKYFLVLAALLLSSRTVIAEDLKTILNKVEQLSSEGNYSKALEELSWAKKELETQYLAKLSTFLPETIGELKGGKVESNSAMGFTNVSRTYTGGSNSVKVQIQGGSAGGAQAGFGGLAALGQMAAMFGGQNGQATMRINGRTATSNTAKGELTVFLEGGSMLTLQKESGSPDLKAVAEAMKLDEIEKFIKGSK